MLRNDNAVIAGPGSTRRVSIVPNICLIGFSPVQSISQNSS